MNPIEMMREIERTSTKAARYEDGGVVTVLTEEWRSLRAAIEAQAEELLVSKKGWNGAESRASMCADALHKARDRLDNGRDYLMQVPAADIAVDDALTAFGFDRCGFPPEES